MQAFKLPRQFFSLFGDTNFLARFFPALSGSLLVWLPFFLRRWLGASGWLSRAGVVMAFGMAVDPGLVSLSRQVGSPVPALAFTLLALVCLYDRRMGLTGIFAGLALLSGAAFLQGMLILSLSWVLFSLVKRNIAQPHFADEVGDLPTAPTPSKPVTLALFTFGATLLVA